MGGSLRRPRATLIALAALTGLAALLRFSTLDLQSYWFDESVTVSLVRLDLGGMLERIPASESTPPLYYLLAWLWSKAFGSGEAGLRSLSALLGAATVPLAYAAARELCSRRVGLAVAALTTSSLWAFARFVRRPSGAAAAAWGAASALALLSHYFALFVVAAEAAWLVAAPGSRRRALPALAAVAVVAGALVPLAEHQRSLELASFISGDPLGFRLARAGKNLLVGFDSPLERELAVLAIAITVAGAAAAWAWTRGRERSGARIAAVVGGTALVLTLVLAVAGADYIDSRNLLVAWLPLMVVVAAGLARTRVGVVALTLLALVGLAAVIGVALEPSWQREDWRGMARALPPPTGPRVILTPALGRRPLELYLPRLSELPQSGRPVKEIALLYPVRRKPGEEHPLPPPRPATPAAAGFSPVERRFESSYTLLLFRAPKPLPFGVPGALALRPSRAEPTAVLLQR